MTRNAYVYVIFRTDGSPCYIGKGKGNRWNNHATRSTNPHLANIIRKAGGDLPKVKVRHGLTDEEAFAIEVALIAAIGRRATGGPLVNMTDGGDGLRDPSPEIRMKMSAKAIARTSDPKWRAEMSAKQKGKTIPDDTRAKMSESHRGKKKTPEHQAAINRALTGLPKTPEHLAAFSRARKGVRVRPASESRKAAIRAASLNYWERWRAGGISRRMRGKNRNTNQPALGL